MCPATGLSSSGSRRGWLRSGATRSFSRTHSRCGCPDGLILGTADPGGTIERLDPYDRQLATTLTLIVGKGGGGKTVTSILLACRFIAQGGRIYITDRSSTPDDRGDSKGKQRSEKRLSYQKTVEDKK